MNREKRIKIMEFVFALGIGGMERGVVNLLLNLDHKKFEPVVCCLGKRMKQANILEEKGIKVYYLDREEDKTNYFLIFKIAQILRKEKIDLIHTHNLCGYLYGVPASILAGTKGVIHSEHGLSLPERKVLMFVRHILAWKINKIVARSEKLREEIIHYWNLKERKVTSIASGINGGFFEKEFDKFHIRNKMGFKEDDYLIGIVARLEDIKDHKTLLKSISLLKEKVSNVKLIVVGDGSLRKSLEDLSLELGIKNNVYFLGEKMDIAPILSILDLFILTSRKEGTSTAIMEAMASRLPIIASRTGGNPELIKDNYNGLLFNVGNEDDLRDKIMYIYNNKDKAGMLKENAYKVFSENYRIERMYKDYQDLFLKTMDG